MAYYQTAEVQILEESKATNRLLERVIELLVSIANPDTTKPDVVIPNDPTPTPTYNPSPLRILSADITELKREMEDTHGFATSYGVQKRLLKLVDIVAEIEKRPPPFQFSLTQPAVVPSIIPNIFPPYGGTVPSAPWQGNGTVAVDCVNDATGVSTTETQTDEDIPF